MLNHISYPDASYNLNALVQHTLFFYYSMAPNYISLKSSELEAVDRKICFWMADLQILLSAEQWKTGF